MRILYHCACAEGGLAEYSLRQAAALARQSGVELLWHAPASLGLPADVKVVEPVASPRNRKRNKLSRAAEFVRATIQPIHALAREVRRTKPDVVVLSAWGEYFAPLWAPSLRALQRKGVRFGAVIHDPVRDNVLGPLPWHRWSVREAYSFLDVAFTHDSSAPNTCGSKKSVRVVQVPHGPYVVPEEVADRVDVRRQLGIPAEAKVLLSFGHIRDGKNLDQVIGALRSLPEFHLVIAGREQSQGQKPAEYYRGLANTLGVAERCHFHTDYIPNKDVWRFFRASDLLVLTYSPSFRSASGVLNVNSQFGLPVLVSSGRSPLLDAVETYSLGTVIDIPDAELIACAVPAALNVTGDWSRFRAENSWDRNAEKVVEALK
jgi:glycosyltransferase involved in cell wall biosynthesis